MQFRLQVPMGNFTRSVSPQNGTSAEYAVDLSHSYLILFSGVDENNAVARSVYKLDSSFIKEDGQNVTASSSFVTQIVRNNIGDNDKLYAFVILNASESLFNFTVGANAADNMLRCDSVIIVGKTDIGRNDNIRFSDFLALKAGFNSGVRMLPRLIPGSNDKSTLEKPRDFDPFGQAGFAHLWLQYD